MRRQRTYTALIEQDETGAYIGKVPDLKGGHTHARSIPELLTRVREAIELCFAVGPHGQSPWHPLRRPSTRLRLAQDDPEQGPAARGRGPRRRVEGKEAMPLRFVGVQQINVPA